MPLYRYKEFAPKIGRGVFIAPDAVVSGRVSIADDANIWFKVVARGDDNEIVIGKGCNIQDLSILHITAEFPLHIGDGTSVGHMAILHACTIAHHCLIGMGAKVLDGAFIDHHSVVAAGSVVPPGKSYPPYSMIMGQPAKVVRALTEQEIQAYGHHFESYVQLKDDYLNEEFFKRIDPEAGQ